ncbi:MAG: tryptophan synthase subunit alpha, partial [Desulfovibrio sp.]|nr:tryptophan synthase subunit alpha [Desulfovibrio sp.]
MHFLEKKVREANAAGRKALVPFLTAGYPDMTAFWPTLIELDENGADVIEIGVPFSDPVADGPVVEDASRLALSEGVCLSDIVKELKSRRGLIKAGIVLMGYYNPFLQYGIDNLAR